MVGKRKDGSIISRTARIKDKRIQILSVDLTNKKCRIVLKGVLNGVKKKNRNDCSSLCCNKSIMDIGATEIKKWHVDDNGWDDIGYHYIIKRGGLVEVGRPEGFQGAHAPAANSKSIGICLVGGMADDGGAENNFTMEQFLSLKDLIKKD